ncbi:MULTISPECIES: nicotianamine synthase family protein [Pseudonocardia]|uniref:nicotianamine synthase family protein n=1 Tax=Pseudonocardia TaxID=1847 RepID=UPI0013027BED|nr:MULTISPECIES: nicotianamine synthase family protein [Pseudonocardia]
MTTQSSQAITAIGVPAPRAPRDGGGAADRTADRLVALCEELERTDLRPSPVVDAAFGELVRLCCHPPAGVIGQVLDRLAPHVDRLRRLSSAGEGLMERYWADRIVGAPDPAAELEQFPYLGNYLDLVRLELAALDAVGLGVPRRVVVLGSGPLPLTGLVLAARHGAEVLHVDRDPAALAAGTAVAEAIGTRTRAMVADLSSAALPAELVAEIGCADLVLLGALVGADAAAKDAITTRLADVAGPDTGLLVRTAAGLRTLLYPEVLPADLPGLDVLLEVHPRTDVVNSVLVARAPG